MKNNLKCYINKDIVCFETNVSKILEYKIWEGNRLVDNLRINNILDCYISDKYKYIPSVLYITDNNEIFDGAHRFLAAKELYYKHKIDLKVIIYKLQTKDILKYFNSVNNGIPVPDIYKSGLKTHNKDLCVSIVKFFTINYKEFMSVSAKPRKPNFNQDILTDNLSEVLEKFTNLNYEQVIKSIKDANNKIKNDCNTVDCDKYKKCKQYDFYLFLDDNWKNIISEYMSKNINDPFNLFT